MNTQVDMNTQVVKGKDIMTFTQARIRLEEVLDLALKVRAAAMSIEYKIDYDEGIGGEKEATEIADQMSMPERAFDLAVRIESILNSTGSTLERISARIG